MGMNTYARGILRELVAQTRVLSLRLLVPKSFKSRGPKKLRSVLQNPAGERQGKF